VKRNAVGDCKCDQFYQVEVCTEHDEDCAVSLQISCRPYLRPVEKTNDRRPRTSRTVQHAVLMLQDCRRIRRQSPKTANIVASQCGQGLRSANKLSLTVQRMSLALSAKAFGVSVLGPQRLPLISARNTWELCKIPIGPGGAWSPNGFSVHFVFKYLSVQTACSQDKNTTLDVVLSSLLLPKSGTTYCYQDSHHRLTPSNVTSELTNLPRHNSHYLHLTTPRTSDLVI